MKTFTSNPKGVPAHRQDMKAYAHANPKEAGAPKRPV